MVLGVDVGGTFTDAVLYDGERLHTAKAPTTPADQSRGVIDAVAAVLDAAGTSPAAVERFVHGMTVGTNALLEERGARTALVATEGFTDLLDIGRQNRPHLYRLCAPKPRPLVPDDIRVAARERTGPQGVIEALDEQALDDVVEAVRAGRPESVAVCLLFSYLDDSHERAIATRLRQELPGVHVSASHEVLPRFREYERCSTTAIDAYLSPLIAGYLGRLGETAAKIGLPKPQVMLSSGGVAPAQEAARSGARTVLSGPAGGAIGAELVARLAEAPRALGFDMGGTSCDVCAIDEAGVRRSDGREIAGRPLQLPMVDVHTVGAGGGSIAWRDAGGALRVGPRSAGAEPGPACYGRGGTEPTVTDANLMLGYLAPGPGLAGGVELDDEAARAAIGRLARALGIEPIEAAEGIVRVANQEMLRALRVVTVERGIDPRRFALLPFGGAGAMHAAALAAELEIDRVLCPRAGGVLSAVGLIASERRRDLTKTVMLSGESLSAERVAAEVARSVESLRPGFEAASPEVFYALRYRGQAFEIEVAGNTAPDPAELAERFAAEHERRYGYRDPEAEAELVDIRVALAEPGPAIEPAAAPDGAPERGARRARFGGEWVETTVWRGEPAAAFSAEGPCIVELPESTLVAPPGWRLAGDDRGTIAMTRERA